LLSLAAEADTSGSSTAGPIKIVSGRLPVVELDYVIRERSHQSLYWLDNERLIFAGLDPKEPIRKTADGFPTYSYFIFKPADGTVVKYAEGNGYLCYWRGYVVRIESRPGKRIWWEGELGKETSAEVTGNPPTRRSPLTCREYDAERVRLPDGRIGQPLLEGHGTLDLAWTDHAQFDKPVRLFKTTGELVELPFKNRDVRGTSIRYYDAFDAYLLSGTEPSEVFDRSDSAKPKRVGVPKKVYLLRASGEVETIAIPYHDWHRGLGDVQLSRAGPLMITAARDSRTNHLHTEVFLLRDNRWDAILDGGRFVAASVSPDGCKLALVQARVAQLNARPALRAVNVCERGEGN
jgi:hypothetical protein